MLITGVSALIIIDGLTSKYPQFTRGHASHNRIISSFPALPPTDAFLLYAAIIRLENDEMLPRLSPQSKNT